MAKTNSLCLYIGRNALAIPIKAGDLKFDVYIGKKSGTAVVLAGQRFYMASANDAENTQKIEVMVPYMTDNNVDVRLLIQKETESAKQGGDEGLFITLKGTTGSGKDIEIRYKNCHVVDGGTVEDKDGRFIPYTFEGIHIVPGV